MAKKFVMMEIKDAGWPTKKLRWKISTRGTRDLIIVYSEYRETAEIIYYALVIWLRLGKILAALQQLFHMKSEYNKGNIIWKGDFGAEDVFGNIWNKEKDSP